MIPRPPVRWVGIDVGLGGAVAMIDDGGGLAAVHDVPTLVVGAKGRRDYDAQGVVALVRGLLRDGPLCVALEQCFSPRGAGMQSFGLGLGFGLWCGVLSSLGVGYTTVPPAAWKRRYGLLKAGKDAATAAALRLYPSADPLLRRRQDHNRAEAILLADYVRQIRPGG